MKGTYSSRFKYTPDGTPIGRVLGDKPFQVIGEKRRWSAEAYNEAVKKYNPENDYPSGKKAKRIARLYNIYQFYLTFKPGN